MNRTSIPLSVAILAGAFLIYCGGQAAQQVLGDGGIVGTADAQQEGGSCCTPPAPMRTRLKAGSLSAGQQTEPIAVDAYSSLVLARGEYSQCIINVDFYDLPDDGPYLEWDVNSSGSVVPVVGNYVRLRVSESCPESPPYVLVGVN